MNVYTCWDESNTDEDGAEEYDAFDAEIAAELCAEDELDNSGGECGNAIEIHVRCPDGSLEIYSVTLDYQPVFSAKKREPASASEKGKL